MPARPSAHDPTASPTILAAGVVVHDAKGRVALVHRPRYDDWSLPKGKLEKREDAAVAAVRECREETGVRARLEVPLPEVTYAVGGRPKVVRYWRAAIDGDDGFVAGTEVDQLRWVPPEQAASVLTNPADAVVVAASAELGPTFALAVLRHAEAVPRAVWAAAPHPRPSDDARPLTAHGSAQARSVATLLACYRPRRVVSSPAQRCRQTVEPLAAVTHTVIELDERYSESSAERDPGLPQAAAAALAAEHLPSVLCTHRPVLPHVVATLVTAAGPRSHEPAAASGRVAGLVASEPPLEPAGCLVLHRDSNGTIRAYERHRPA